MSNVTSDIPDIETKRGDSIVESTESSTSTSGTKFLGLPELNIVVNDLQNELNKQKKESDALTDKLDGLQKTIQEGKERVTETLAIFVGIFTFVSINFNFFSNKCLNTVKFFTLDLNLGAFLVFFIVLLRLLIGPVDSRKLHQMLEFWLLIVSFVLIAGSSLVLFLVKEPDCENIQENEQPLTKFPLIEQNFTQFVSTQSAFPSK